MKIVLTGSNGFLGRRVYQELLEHGYEVLPVDISADGDQDEMPTTILDISKPNEIDAISEGADAICHLGNQPGIRESRNDEGFANNTAATFNVFQAALKSGVRKIVWASSIQAYGVAGNKRRGVSAPVYLPVDEAHPQLPQTAYQLSKQVGENIADAFLRRRPDMQIFSLRFTYISGPGFPIDKTSSDVVGSLLTHIDIADAARAVRLCLETDRPGHTPLNIIASRPTGPWSREALIDAYGVLPEIRNSLNEQDSLISAKLAKEIIGFEA